MKLRIKVETLNNGSTWYTPQVCKKPARPWMKWWEDDVWRNIDKWGCEYTAYDDDWDFRFSETEARAIILAFRNRFNEQNEKKVASIQYIEIDISTLI